MNNPTNSNHGSFFSSQKTEKNSGKNNSLQKREKSGIRYQNLQSQKLIMQRASQFIYKLRERKKQFEGKLLMIKRAQAQKRAEQQKKKQIQKEVQKQLQRKIRRMKAQANVEYYTQKKKINESSIKSRSHSPKQRKLSQFSQQERQVLKLPAIEVYDLQQIKQQQANLIPEGIPTARRKRQNLKRSNTESHHYEAINVSQEPSKQIKLINEKKNKRTVRNRIKSQEYDNDDNHSSDKKTYLMSRNKTDEIAQYLENLSGLEHLKSLVENKSFKKTNVGNIKNFMKTKRVNRIVSSSLLDSYDLKNSPGNQFKRQKPVPQQKQQP